MEFVDKGDVLVSSEIQDLKVLELGSPASGSINPADRVEAGEIKDTTVDQLAAGVGRHFRELKDRVVTVGDKVKTILKTKLIPKWCVDGRPDEDGLELAPNAAGGSYSLVVGDALIDADDLIANKMTSATHGEKLFRMLTANGYDIGGHEDDHAHGDNCGCGACDKMGAIFSFLAENIGELSQKASELGVNIADSLQEEIKTNALNLIDAGYISTGAQMNQSIKNTTDESHSQKLTGAHNEVVLVVNTVEGTSADRKSIENEFGSLYQIFNLDVWALKNGINAVAISAKEAEEKLAAAVLYNLATACVLAGPSLRVVVR